MHSFHIKANNAAGHEEVDLTEEDQLFDGNCLLNAKKSSDSHSLEGLLLIFLLLLLDLVILLYILVVVKVENVRLREQIGDLKFVLDQNASLIHKLKRENDAKSLLILQLQNGTGKRNGIIRPTFILSI